MSRASRIAVLVLSAVLTVGCESMESASARWFGGSAIEAQIVPVANSGSSGFAKFAAIQNGVALQLQLSRVLPSVTYRVVIHTNGNCTSPNGFSAGQPWVPAGSSAGAIVQTFVAGNDGTLSVVQRMPGVHIDGPNSIAGKSVVVHFGANSTLEARPDVPNNRVACGVIGSGRAGGS